MTIVIKNGAALNKEDVRKLLRIMLGGPLLERTKPDGVSFPQMWDGLHVVIADGEVQLTERAPGPFPRAGMVLTFEAADGGSDE